MCMYTKTKQNAFFGGCDDELAVLATVFAISIYDCNEEWDMTGGFGHGHGNWDVGYREPGVLWVLKTLLQLK